MWRGHGRNCAPLVRVSAVGPNVRLRRVEHGSSCETYIPTHVLMDVIVNE